MTTMKYQGEQGPRHPGQLLWPGYNDLPILSPTGQVPIMREEELAEKFHVESDFRSQQFVQLRQFERDAIMQHYGVPPEILGVLTNSNRATIDSADYFMSRYVVDPRLEFQRGVLQERFVPEYDDRLIVEYVSAVQEDKAHHLEVAKGAPWSLTANEWRKMSGHGPLDDESAGLLHAVPSTVQLQPLREYVAAVAVPELPQDEPLPLPGDPEETEPGQGRRMIALHGLAGWKTDLGEDIAAAAGAGDEQLAGWLTKVLKDDEGDLPAPSQVAARHEPGVHRALLRTWKAHANRIDLGRLELALASRTTGSITTVPQRSRRRTIDSRQWWQS